MALITLLSSYPKRHRSLVPFLNPALQHVQRGVGGGDLGMSSRAETKSSEGQVLKFRQVKAERSSRHLQGGVLSGPLGGLETEPSDGF